MEYMLIREKNRGYVIFLLSKSILLFDNFKIK